MLGVRGQRAVDLNALADVLVRFSEMILADRTILEADMNPLLASADGIVALDARIVLRPQGQGTKAAAALCTC